MTLRHLYRKYLPDPYQALERQAIQTEDDLPPDRGWDDVPGFEDVTPISLEAYRALLAQLHPTDRGQDHE